MRSTGPNSRRCFQRRINKDRVRARKKGALAKGITRPVDRTQISVGVYEKESPPHGAEKRCTKLNPDSSTDWQSRFDSDYPCGHGTPKKPSGPITFGVGKSLITPIVPMPIVPIRSSRTIVGTDHAKSD